MLVQLVRSQSSLVIGNTVFAMNANAFIKVDKATFYRFVQAQSEGRFEYVQGRIMQQMAGGTHRHAEISKRFLLALHGGIEQSKWTASGPDRGVETHVTIRYPDASIEPVGADPKSLATLSPVVLVEVLSPYSEDRDMFVKPLEYLALPSLQAYVIASQDEVACFVYLRGPNGTFTDEPETVQGADKAIDIPALSLSIPLAEIYRGLFEPIDADSAPKS